MQVWLAPPPGHNCVFYLGMLLCFFLLPWLSPQKAVFDPVQLFLGMEELRQEIQENKNINDCRSHQYALMTS